SLPAQLIATVAEGTATASGVAIVEDNRGTGLATATGAVSSMEASTAAFSLAAAVGTASAQLESTASGSTTTASLAFSTVETIAQGRASSTGNAHVLTRVRRIIAFRAFGRETVVRVEPI